KASWNRFSFRCASKAAAKCRGQTASRRAERRFITRTATNVNEMIKNAMQYRQPSAPANQIRKFSEGASGSFISSGTAFSAVPSAAGSGSWATATDDEKEGRELNSSPPRA